MEDQFERKEDMSREDYLRRRSQILSERPYTTTVKQRGTFYSTKDTFGTDRDFKAKKPWPKNVPKYGPFKNPDPPHRGYNKTIGRNYAYTEEEEQDPVAYQKGVK